MDTKSSEGSSTIIRTNCLFLTRRNKSFGLLLETFFCSDHSRRMDTNFGLGRFFKIFFHPILTTSRKARRWAIEVPY